ncbi:MAG TPA: hypothetical protein VGE70_09595 [Burkholderiaceae bacterium]
MAKKDWAASLKTVNFKCTVCTFAFESVPDLIEDAPEIAHHPYRYFAHCPTCTARNQPQATWEANLIKAHQASTGPKTPEGIAKVSANIAGHPTPEESLRIRFNAMKHGLNARTASYFPAKPDKYEFCKRCDVDRDWCSGQPACVKQTEIFMLHHAAHEQRNPRVLTAIHADLQAALTAALQMCLQTVLADGVVLKTPRVELSKEGSIVQMGWYDAERNFHPIYDYAANPAFKPIADLISRLGLSISDLGMTVRAADAEEERQAGRLTLGDKDTEELGAFSQRMVETMRGAQQLLSNAQAARKADPVFVEHQARGGEG